MFALLALVNQNRYQQNQPVHQTKPKTNKHKPNAYFLGYIYIHTYIHTYIHACIHFYSGICTGTGNIFIGDFCMNMLQWFWESTPKWLSFKMRLSFWLQLTYWYDQMRKKGWHLRVAWPRIELSTSRVTGGCLIHYTTSDSVNTMVSQELYLALTPNLRILRKKSYHGYNRHRDIHEIWPRS